MVLNNHSYEDQTRRRLAETQSELNTLEVEIGNLEEKRATLRVEVQAYQTILESCLRRRGKEDIGPDWDKLLADKTHGERLVIIAQQTGAAITITQATDILYTKGFIKSKRRSNAYSMVQHLLADMAADGIFEKVAAGEYRLKAVSKSS